MSSHKGLFLDCYHNKIESVLGRKRRMLTHSKVLKFSRIQMSRFLYNPNFWNVSTIVDYF